MRVAVSAAWAGRGAAGAWRGPRPAPLEPLERHDNRDDQRGIQREVLDGGQLVHGRVLAHYDGAPAPVGRRSRDLTQQ
jgi:hypothetical protein